MDGESIHVRQPPPVQGATLDAWRGELELRYAAHEGRTRLVHRRHVGPLLVQRPFYPESVGCHTYVLHPPGGQAGGDELIISVGVESGAAALLTTPGAGKFYRGDFGEADQTQILTVAPEAELEWLPQASIVFAGARVRTATQVKLDASARFVGWEIHCLGRPRSGEEFATGILRQQVRFELDGRPLLIERGEFPGGSDLLRARSGLAGFPVMGAMWAWPGTPCALAAAREALAGHGHSAATVVRGLLVCRALSSSTEAIGARFQSVWRALRPLVMARPAVPPRVWAT